MSSLSCSLNLSCNFSLIQGNLAIPPSNFLPAQEMVTLLGTAFSTDEQVMAEGDVNFMGMMVKSLVVEFDQAKYEEFLSSGSKSPRVVR